MKLEGYLYQGKFYKSLGELKENEMFSDVDKPVRVYSGDLKDFAREAIDLGLSLGTKADWGKPIDDRKELARFYKENVIE